MSHGQQGDPHEVPLSEEIVAEPIAFLRLMPGGAVPEQGAQNPFCPLDADGEFGVWGKETTRRLRRRLNANTF